jgi:hypothetical protein
MPPWLAVSALRIAEGARPPRGLREVEGYAFVILAGFVRTPTFHVFVQKKPCWVQSEVAAQSSA